MEPRKGFVRRFGLLNDVSISLPHFLAQIPQYSTHKPKPHHIPGGALAHKTPGCRAHPPPLQDLSVRSSRFETDASPEPRI